MNSFNIKQSELLRLWVENHIFKDYPYSGYNITDTHQVLTLMRQRVMPRYTVHEAILLNHLREKWVEMIRGKRFWVGEPLIYDDKEYICIKQWELGFGLQHLSLAKHDSPIKNLGMKYAYNYRCEKLVKI